MRKNILALLTFFAAGNAYASVTPVSEPGTISLLGMGTLATILAIRYFRR